MPPPAPPPFPPLSPPPAGFSTPCLVQYGGGLPGHSEDIVEPSLDLAERLPGVEGLVVGSDFGGLQVGSS